MNEDCKVSPCLVNESKRSNTNNCCRVNSIQLRRQSPLLSMPLPLEVDTNVNLQQEQRLIDPFQDENRPMEVTTKKNNESSSKNAKSGIGTCNMCCRNGDVCVNLQNNHSTVLTVSDITRLPSWNIREILSSVCSRCLVYVGAITESSSKLRMRCEQAMHSQSMVLAPPTPDTSPNNFLQVSSTLLDDNPDQTNGLQKSHNCYAPDFCDDEANDLALPSSSPPPALLSNQTLDATAQSPTNSNAGNDSMLQIRYERSVSPLNTESGGGKNNKRSYQRVQVIPVQMICSHCNRTYWRKDYFRKHIRRCGAKYRYAQSLIPTRSRSLSRMELDNISVLSEGNEHISLQNPPRIFRCNECTVTVENVSKLRQHKRIHLPRFYCDICSSEYTTQNEYDFHRVQCTAKLEVFEKGLENIRNLVNSPEPLPARRKTRSYSRALSLVQSLPPSKAHSTNGKKTDVTPAKKSKSSNSNAKKRTQLKREDTQSTITTFIQRNRHLYTNAEDIQRNSKKIPYHNDNSTEGISCDPDHDNEDNNNDDDDVSEVDTLYSKRLSLTNHWVEEHSLSSHSHLSQGDNYIEDYVEDIPFRSLKEYDLYLLDRLKVEVRQHSLTCFVPGCEFTSPTLNEIMIHDYIYHFKKPWYYCHKCGYCFTSKVFLDYHLDMQNKGRYVCYKCGGHFEYQHQLDRHLIHHARQTSDMNEKYICYFCNFEFLDEDKLMRHCQEEKHNRNKKRPIIKIDRTMTISNKVPQKYHKTRRNHKKYEVKILKMVLKHTPSKRCIPMEKYRSHLPPHLRIPNRIGQVEFRHATNPNCVGCL